jgi:hypothetical protein
MNYGPAPVKPEEVLYDATITPFITLLLAVRCVVWVCKLLSEIHEVWSYARQS